MESCRPPFQRVPSKGWHVLGIVSLEELLFLRLSLLETVFSMIMIGSSVEYRVSGKDYGS